jgi:hypothetical protein
VGSGAPSSVPRAFDGLSTNDAGAADGGAEPSAAATAAAAGRSVARCTSAQKFSDSKRRTRAPASSLASIASAA